MTEIARVGCSLKSLDVLRCSLLVKLDVTDSKLLEIFITGGRIKLEHIMRKGFPQLQGIKTVMFAHLLV